MKMNKKLIAGVVLLVLLLAPLSSFALALERSYLPPDYYGSRSDSQYYSVLYDDEQEAAVAAYVSLTNNGQENLSEVIIEIPGSNVRLINAIQESREMRKQCSNWQDVCTSLSGDECESYSRKCLSWYTDYYGYSPSYYVLDRSVEQLSFSAKYTVQLEKPVAAGETATLLLYYKSSGTASESYGMSKFSFETLKIPYDTQTVRVAINVQPGMRLKGSTSKVTSLPNFDVAASFESKGMASAELSSFSSSIQYQNGYVKQAYSLDPWESFVVKGSYSSSWLALYWPKVLMWVVIGIAIVALVVLLIAFTVRKLKEGRKSVVPKMLLAAFSSTVFSLFLLVVSFLLLAFTGGYGYYSYSQPVALLVLLLVLILIMAAILGPAFYLGIKHGFVIGLATFLLTIFMISVGVVGLFLLLMLLSSRSVIYY